jgi:hypothetical protein
MTADATKRIPRSRAMQRCRRLLDWAMGQFCALPCSAARNAVELAMEAVQLADRLQEDPACNQEGQLRRWEDAWLLAHLAVYRLARQRRDG